jgi:hypothetical protein
MGQFGERQGLLSFRAPCASTDKKLRSFVTAIASKKTAGNTAGTQAKR